MTAYAIPTELLPARVATMFQFAKAIVPADNTQIGPFAGFYVGGFGDVTVCARNGDGQGGVTVVTLKAVSAGTLIPLGIQGVNATNTNATNIIGLG